MLEIKRDPYALAFYAICVLAATYLLAKGVVTWREVGIFFGSGAALPALVGRRGSADETEEKRSTGVKEADVEDRTDPARPSPEVTKAAEKEAPPS